MPNLTLIGSAARFFSPKQRLLLLTVSIFLIVYSVLSVQAVAAEQQGATGETQTPTVTDKPNAFQRLWQRLSGEGAIAGVTHKPEVFQRLWRVYPNKEDQEAAIQAWNELKVSDEELNQMRAAYPRWKFSDQWMREKGKHVPPLATWLNERLWEKEPPPPAPLPPLRVAELSSFLLQPMYLAPRLAFFISGTVIGGIIWPVNEAAANKVWDASIDAPWLWHEFIGGEESE